MKDSFKNYFFSKVKDPEIFNCDNFNIIKIVMDGLKINYANKGKVRVYFFYSSILYYSILWLKRLRFNMIHRSAKEKLKEFEIILNSNGEKKLAILDENRHVLNSGDKQYKSYYFNNIIDLLGRSNILFLSMFNSKHPELYDIVPIEYEDVLNNVPYSKEDRILRSSFIKTFKRISKERIFSVDDLENIKIAIDLFFIRYRTWNAIFKMLNIEKVYMTEHYHREGIILALKKNNIKVCELQHGLISKEKSFYIWPDKVKSIVPKALFSDVIFVYGNYWKHNLLKGNEYNEDQIKVIGRYFMEDNSSDPYFDSFVENNIPKNFEVVLFASQFTVAQQLIAYIKWLEQDIVERKQSVIILVKPHPAEDPNLFDCFSDSAIVKIVFFDLERLFKISTIFISGYSASFYDATRYPVLSFALFVEEYATHVNAIVESGIATLIKQSENPVTKKGMKKNLEITRSEYSEIFNSRVLRDS